MLCPKAFFHAVWNGNDIRWEMDIEPISGSARRNVKRECDRRSENVKLDNGTR